MEAVSPKTACHPFLRALVLHSRHRRGTQLHIALLGRPGCASLEMRGVVRAGKIEHAPHPPKGGPRIVPPVLSGYPGSPTLPFPGRKRSFRIRAQEGRHAVSPKLGFPNAFALPLPATGAYGGAPVKFEWRDYRGADCRCSVRPHAPVQQSTGDRHREMPPAVPARKEQWRRRQPCSPCTPPTGGIGHTCPYSCSCP